MGININIFVEMKEGTEPPHTPCCYYGFKDEPEEGWEFIDEESSFICDELPGPGIATHEMNSLDRWHDAVDYPRGYWPDILESLLILFRDENVIRFWYGADVCGFESHRQVTKEYIAYLIDRNSDGGVLSAHKKLDFMSVDFSEFVGCDD